MSTVDQCLLVSLEGETVDADLLRWIRDGLAGVILFARNVASPKELRQLTDELRSARPDVIVAIDEEGGDVTRLEARDGSSFPGNLALGRLDDPVATRACAEAIGRALVDAGVNLDLAPVADVNTTTVNPVIGTRSFGADPGVVARNTAAFVRGLQAAGVAACAKHFPGHGSTTLDSHLCLPSDSSSLEELTAVHLRPFIAAIEADVASIMTAHVRYPSLSAVPATIAPEILTGLLRQKLGFDGVVVTDALEMKAISATIGVVPGALASLRAGADLICVDSPRPVQLEVRAALAHAATTGALPAATLEAAAERVTRLATTFPGKAPASPTVWSGIGLELARRAIVVDAPGLPLRTPPFVLDTTATTAHGVARTTGRLRSILESRGCDAVGALEPDPLAAKAAGFRAPADRPLVVVVRDAHRRDAVRALVLALLEHRDDAVVVATGLPADHELAPGRFIGALAGGRASLTAAAERLWGR